MGSRLRRVHLRRFALALTRPLGTAHGRIEARPGWLVRLEAEDGSVGLGEATPLAAFGTESLPACEAALEAALRSLHGAAAAPLEDRLECLTDLRTDAPCAVAAIDTALHDLEARRAGLALAEWLRRRTGGSGPAARSVAVQALVGGGSPEAVAEAVTHARRTGHAAVKLKLATGTGEAGPGDDVARVAAARTAAGPAMRLRLDANEAWSREQAAERLASLSDYAVDFVEQPIARGDVDGLAALAARCEVAVAADESLLGDGLERCLARRAAPVFVLKPTALGGIAAARTAALRAADLGIRVVWSTLLDGAVGRAAALHLALALGAPDEVHGLATGDWIEHDLAPTASVRAGRLEGGAGAGLGLDAGEMDRSAGAPWTGPAWAPEPWG